MEPITVWTKPSCVQCNMVKARLIELMTSKRGLSPAERDQEWDNLKQRGWVQDADLTADEHSKDLSYFKGLGYSSAPLTEFNNSIVPGFDRAGVDRLHEAWSAQLEAA